MADYTVKKEGKEYYVTPWLRQKKVGNRVFMQQMLLEKETNEKKWACIGQADGDGPCYVFEDQVMKTQMRVVENREKMKKNAKKTTKKRR